MEPPMTRVLGWRRRLLGVGIGFAVALGVLLILRVTRSITAPPKVSSGVPTAIEDRLPVDTRVALEEPSVLLDPRDMAPDARSAQLGDESLSLPGRGAPGNPSSHFIWGRIASTDGSPIAGARVGASFTSEERVRVVSDPEGHYLLGPIDAGPWSLAARAANYQSSSFDVEVVGTPTSLRQDFTLRPVSLDGQEIDVHALRPTGEPLFSPLDFLVHGESLAVAMDRRLPRIYFGRSHWTSPTHGAGHFRSLTWQQIEGTDDLPPDLIGRVSLESRGSGWLGIVVGGQVIAQQSFGPETEALQFVVAPQTISTMKLDVSGQLVDSATGLGVGGSVRLSHQRTSGQATETDGAGQFLCEGIYPDQRLFEAKSEGYAPVQLELDLEAGISLDLGTLELDRAGSLGGVVRDPEGEPTGAIVECIPLDPATGALRPQERRGCLALDTDGIYGFNGLAPGRYQVQCNPGDSMRASSPSGVSVPYVVNIESDRRTNLDLSAEAPTVVTLVTGRHPDQKAWARVMDGGGAHIRSYAVGRGAPAIRMRLLPGDYTLRIERVERTAIESRFTVGSDPIRFEASLD